MCYEPLITYSRAVGSGAYGDDGVLKGLVDEQRQQVVVELVRRVHLARAQAQPDKVNRHTGGMSSVRSKWSLSHSSSCQRRDQIKSNHVRFCYPQAAWPLIP
jgi:hypothetical protein